MLELAHIMIFIMACVFCVVIAILYYMVRSRKHAHTAHRHAHVTLNTLPLSLPHTQVKRIEREWYRIEDPLGSIYEATYDPWAAPQQALHTLEQSLDLPPSWMAGRRLSTIKLPGFITGGAEVGVPATAVEVEVEPSVSSPSWLHRKRPPAVPGVYQRGRPRPHDQRHVTALPTRATTRKGGGEAFCPRLPV